ncbi:hypothetical protein PFISCL1PPCAC_20232, partial [Pristionchus fissidentatus]
ISVQSGRIFDIRCDVLTLPVDSLFNPHRSDITSRAGSPFQDELESLRASLLADHQFPLQGVVVQHTQRTGGVSNWKGLLLVHCPQLECPSSPSEEELTLIRRSYEKVFDGAAFHHYESITLTLPYHDDTECDRESIIRSVLTAMLNKIPGSGMREVILTDSSESVLESISLLMGGQKILSVKSVEETNDITHKMGSSGDKRSSFPGEKRCALCLRGFTTISSLNRHLRKLHGIDTSQGNAGYVLYPPSDGLDASLSSLVNEKSLIAPHLNLSTTTEDEDGPSTSSSRVPTIKYCDKCDKHFCSQSTLNRHLRNVHGVHTSKCDSSVLPIPSSSSIVDSIASLINGTLPFPIDVDTKEVNGMVEVKEEEEEYDDDHEPFSIEYGDNKESIALMDTTGAAGMEALVGKETIDGEFVDLDELRCSLCSKEFSHQSTLNRHLRNIHNVTTIRKEQPMMCTACSFCGEIFRSRTLARRHRREKHSVESRIYRGGTACCIEGCAWAGHTHRELVTHAQSRHSSPSSPFQWESRTFDTKEEFDRWINELYSQGQAWYSRSSKIVDGVKQEYRYCHLEMSKGRKEPENRQRIKKSKKSQMHCTSYIKMLTHPDGSISVEFCLDHIGHSIDCKDRPNPSGEDEGEGEEMGESSEEEEEGEEDEMDEIKEEEEDMDARENGETSNIQAPGGNRKALLQPSSSSGAVKSINNVPSPSSYDPSLHSAKSLRKCHLCDRRYSCNSTLNRHLREIHKQDLPKMGMDSIYTACSECGEIFASQSKMRAHRMVAHPLAAGLKMCCPIENCDWIGLNHRDLIKHARVSHYTNKSRYLWESRIFKSKEEFDEWLEGLKRRGVHFYIRRSEKKRCTVNRCCRFEVNRQPLNASLRQRIRTTRKTVCSCTCYLTTNTREDGSVFAGYCLDHLGHTVEIDNRGKEGSSEYEEVGDIEEEEEEEGESEQEESMKATAKEEPENGASLNGKYEEDEVEEEHEQNNDEAKQRLDQALNRLREGAMRLRTSDEMDRLISYLNCAFVATGLQSSMNGGEEKGETVKRKNEATNGVRSNKRPRRHQ